MRRKSLNYLPLTEADGQCGADFLGCLTAERGERRGGAGAAEAARLIHYSERTYAEIIRRSVCARSDEAQVANTWLESHAIDQKRVDALRSAGLACAPAGRRASTRRIPGTFQETTQWLQLLKRRQGRVSGDAEVAALRAVQPKLTAIGRCHAPDPVEPKASSNGCRSLLPSAAGRIAHVFLWPRAGCRASSRHVRSACCGWPRGFSAHHTGRASG